MKVLIDESIDVDFRHELAEHEVYTFTFMTWNGTKNGVLLARAAAHGSDAIVTTDRNIEYQQDISTLPCAIVVIEARSNDFNDLKALASDVLRALSHLRPKTIAHVKA